MKKHIFRQKRSCRSQLAGLALAAVLAVFPGGQVFGDTLNVGPGKPYSTLEDLRQHREVWNGDVIVVFSNDFSMIGPLNIAFQNSTESASIRADGTENRSISYAGLKNVESRVVGLELGTFHFGENLTFTDYKQTEYGGVGFVSQFGTITVDGSDFVSNLAELGGGALANEGATLQAKNSLFSRNDAFFGGVLYTNGGVSTLNSITATGNTARQGGAVFHAAGNLTVFDSLFENNQATRVTGVDDEGFGGAMAVAGGQVIVNNTDFINNSAAAKGGAVYVSGASTLNIVADEGVKSLWQGNVDASGANSIFFDLDTDGALLQQLNVYGDGDVSMEGPLRAEKTVANSNALSVKKWGAGKWYLGGSNVFTGIASEDVPEVTLKTIMEIMAGTLELGKDAEIDIQSGSFLVKSGATLTTLGNNTITVKGATNQAAVAMETGSRIEVNMTAMQAGDDNTVAMLTFDGQTFDENKGRDELDMSFGTITVDVSVVNAYNGDGDYTLVFAKNADFSNAELLIGGVVPTKTDDEEDKNDRIGTRTIEAVSSAGSRTPDTIVLTLEGVDDNRQVFWNGTENPVWSENVANWTNPDTASAYFLNGDDIVFGDDENIAKNVSVDENGVRFGTMTVQADYSFSDGDLYGEKIEFEKDAVLTFDARTLNLSMNVAENVHAGLVVQAKFEGEEENKKVVPLIITAQNGNSAVTGQAGSVFSVGQEGSEGEIRFVGNNSVNGAAFSGETIKFLGGTNLLTGNSATGSGGAIFARSVAVSGGTAEFRNNSAAGFGGAIYATGNVTLHAGDGDIVFAGNTHNSGEANAIYMANVTSGSLQLTTEAGRTISFSDPIENTASARAAKSFTVGIDGSGTVLFEQYRSNIRGVTTVSGGTMKLTRGAVYGAETGNESFILKNKTVLSVDSSGTGITADSIQLDRGSTIRIDLLGASEATTLLKLDGSVVLPETGGVTLDVLVTSQDGTYKLLTGTETEFQGKFIELINGAPVDENVQNDRYGSREFTYETGAVHLTLKDFDRNRTVNWSGQAGNVWSENAANWTISGTNKKYFLNGDSVVFSDNGLINSIDVADAGVIVADMKVVGGNFNFNGGDIHGNGGTLTKSALGTLTLNQRNVFDFVEVKGGTLAGGNGAEYTIVGDLMFRYSTALAPGSGNTDAFRVDGNIGFESGTYLYLDLGRTLEKSDQLIATGSIDFSNNQQGTVTVVVAASGVSKGTSVTDEAVIQADGGLLLNGKLLSDGETEVRNEKVTLQQGGNRIVIQSDGSLDLESAVVANDGKSMAIHAVGAFDAPEPDAAFSWNQLAVRESIENAQASTFANQLMAKYALTDDEDKQAFLEQLLPTLNSAMPKVTQRAVFQYRQIMFERLRNRNHEQPGQYIVAGEQTIRGQRYCPNAAPITWFQNYGDFMHQKRRDVQSYDSYSYGLAIGTETWMNRDTVIGLGIGAAFASVNTDDRSQKADANTFLFTPYISHTTGDGYKIMASIGYAYNDYEIRRRPGGTEIKSKHNGNVFLINTEISKKLHGIWTDVTPFFGLDLIYLHEEKYREKSDGAVVSTIRAESTNSCLQTIGLRFGRTRMNCFGWLVNPTVSLGWIHDYGDGSIRTVSNYAGGAAYTIRGSSMNRDRFALGLNYCADFNERIGFFTGYNGEFASRYDVHTVQLGCTFEF